MKVTTVVRKHQTLTKQAEGIHKTPAGVADHVWTMEEVVELLEERANKRSGKNSTANNSWLPATLTWGVLPYL